MEPLTVPGVFDSLAAVSAYAEAASAAAGLDAAAAYRFRLAVVELVTNVMEHGYEGTAPGPVRLSAEVSAGALRLTVEDEAPPFDPRDAPAPDVSLAAEDRPIGGLGVYLILRDVDGLEYEYSEGRNRTTVVMNRPG